jgi:hypothetical protein
MDVCCDLARIACVKYDNFRQGPPIEQLDQPRRSQRIQIPHIPVLLNLQVVHFPMTRKMQNIAPFAEYLSQIILSRHHHLNRNVGKEVFSLYHVDELVILFLKGYI